MDCRGCTIIIDDTAPYAKYGRYPEMSADYILRISPKGFHANILLYPPEEHSNVPPGAVGTPQRADIKIISDEDYLPTRLIVATAYNSYRSVYTASVLLCVNRKSKFPRFLPRGKNPNCAL